MTFSTIASAETGKVLWIIYPVTNITRLNYAFCSKKAKLRILLKETFI